jgi:hypothetical protein
MHDEDGLKNHCALLVIAIRHLHHERYGFERERKEDEQRFRSAAIYRHALRVELAARVRHQLLQRCGGTTTFGRRLRMCVCVCVCVCVCKRERKKERK